jgi:hypothetical protein
MGDIIRLADGPRFVTTSELPRTTSGSEPFSEDWREAARLAEYAIASKNK